MATLYGGTLANMLMGPAYIYYGEVGVAAKPAKLDDIITMSTPYAPKTNWLPFGATTDASGYGRGLDEEEFEIQQRTGAIGTKPSAVVRTITIPISEITPETMKIVEVSPAHTTIAAGAGASGTPAQSRLDFGSISTLPRFRIAMIAERDKGITGSSGEGGARGQLVGIVLYNASVTAEDSDLELDRGSLVAREVSFRAFPDPAEANPEKAHGAFIFETGAVVP